MYSMWALLLRDSALDGIIIKTVKGKYTKTEFFSQTFSKWGRHGLVNDCGITLADKTDSSDPTTQGFFWISLLKTYYPLGLNIEEQL